MFKTLAELDEGESGIIHSVVGEREVISYLHSLGFKPGNSVTVKKKNFMGLVLVTLFNVNVAQQYFLNPQEASSIIVRVSTSPRTHYPYLPRPILPFWRWQFPPWI